MPKGIVGSNPASRTSGGVNMTVVYIPINAENSGREWQQQRILSRMIAEGWKLQGTVILTDRCEQTVNIAILFKEEG